MTSAAQARLEINRFFISRSYRDRELRGAQGPRLEPRACAPLFCGALCKSGTARLPARRHRPEKCIRGWSSGPAAGGDSSVGPVAGTRRGIGALLPLRLRNAKARSEQAYESALDVARSREARVVDVGRTRREREQRLAVPAAEAAAGFHDQQTRRRHVPDPS